jgi:hypothetical protein
MRNGGQTHAWTNAPPAARPTTQGSLQRYGSEVFGHKIAECEGYRAVGGLEAVYLYLVHQFRWTPETVRSFSYEDLWFLLAEEFADWAKPRKSTGANL